MNKIYKSILFLVTIWGGTLFSYGQSQKILNFTDYLNSVKNSNIDYVVEKYNVDIANANAQASRVFPDPELSLSYADNQERTLQMGRSYEAGIGYTFELGGKRKARIRVAESEADLTNALLQNYFRNLRADATLSYLAALRQRELLKVAESSLTQMQQLAKGDSIRFKLGAITEADALQSGLEARTMFNEVLQKEAELKNALVQLNLWEGDQQFQKIDSVSGNLTYLKRSFELLTLITSAQDHRADLQAALKSTEVSQRNLRLARANRAIDLGVNLSVNRNTEVRNEIAPAPAYTSVMAGITIPLKFSNRNKGELRAAEYAIRQNEAAYQSVEMQIRTEVTQAYHNYTAACRQAEQFDTGLLSDAKKILASRTYSYQRGETSLLEVLIAQRSYNDIRMDYYETLHDCMAALVELERAVGIWDIEL